MLVGISVKPDVFRTKNKIYPSRYGLWDENIKLTNSFDAQSYLNNYADLRNAFGNDQELATKHYVEYGFNEGRVF